MRILLIWLKGAHLWWTPWKKATSVFRVQRYLLPLKLIPTEGADRKIYELPSYTLSMLETIMCLWFEKLSTAKKNLFVSTAFGCSNCSSICHKFTFRSAGLGPGLFGRLWLWIRVWSQNNILYLIFQMKMLSMTNYRTCVSFMGLKIVGMTRSCSLLHLKYL